METRRDAEHEVSHLVRLLDEDHFWCVWRVIKRAIFIRDTQVKGVVRFLADGTVASWDRGMAEIFGFKASEVVGKRFRDLPHLPPGEVAKMSGLIDYVRAGGRIEGQPLTRLRADGTQINCTITSIPIMSINGGAQGVITTVTASVPRGPKVESLARCAPLLLLVLLCA